MGFLDTYVNKKYIELSIFLYFSTLETYLDGVQHSIESVTGHLDFAEVAGGDLLDFDELLVVARDVDIGNAKPFGRPVLVLAEAEAIRVVEGQGALDKAEAAILLRSPDIPEIGEKHRC